MLKKITFNIIFLLSSLFLLASVSSADVAGGWAECTVLQTQSAKNDVVFLNLTEVNGAFTQTWVQVDKSLNNMALATAFTAMTLGNNVNVKIEDLSGYKITAIRIIAQ